MYRLTMATPGTIKVKKRRKVSPKVEKAPIKEPREAPVTEVAEAA